MPACLRARAGCFRIQHLTLPLAPRTCYTATASCLHLYLPGTLTNGFCRCFCWRRRMPTCRTWRCHPASSWFDHFLQVLHHCHTVSPAPTAFCRARTCTCHLPATCLLLPSCLPGFLRSATTRSQQHLQPAMASPGFLPRVSAVASTSPGQWAPHSLFALVDKLSLGCGCCLVRACILPACLVTTSAHSHLCCSVDGQRT